MSDNLNARIGEHMRKLRTEKHMIIEDVAHRMGYKSKNTLSRMELGAKQITVEDVQKFSEAIGITYIDFFESLVKT
jgi:transcriptional regulator with XRE-family HTH domain